jgi:hypothetical protein
MFSVRNKLNFCRLFRGEGLVSIPAQFVTFVVDKMALGLVSVLVSFHQCSKFVMPILSKGQLYEAGEL